MLAILHRAKHDRPTSMQPLLPRSAVSAIGWPAIPAPAGATLLALQFQLEASQWWSPAEIRKHQFLQLDSLVRHAFETVPFYRDRLGASGFSPRNGLDPEIFARFPVLARHEVQEARERLLSRNLPAGHGKTGETRTAGSTGHPLRVQWSELTRVFWLAFTLRDNLWHRRDLRGRLAAIRSKVESGMLPGWGPALDMVYQSGPAAMLNIATDLERQLAWLEEQAPDYLITHPTNLRELARLALERGVRLPALREAITFGEMLHPELRALCRDAWDVPLTDIYSAEEVGYIALQCPGHGHYHVQAEGLLVEVLDDEGRPCRPGEIGRVVVTSLHNFAMPLIRYALGDWAQVGQGCACGRGLPVLSRIMGRQRNMVALPDGTRHWPSLPQEFALLPIRRRRVVQRSLEQVEVTLEVVRPLTAEEEQRLVQALQGSLGYPFRIALNYVDRLAGGEPDRAGFKCEDFVSEVTGGASGR